MQKNSKTPKKSAGPLIALAVGGLVLVVVAMFLAFGKGGGGDSGVPAVSVDQEVIDYGTVQFGTPLSFKIKVTNTGDGVLRVTESPIVEVREGC